MILVLCLYHLAGVAVWFVYVRRLMVVRGEVPDGAAALGLPVFVVAWPLLLLLLGLWARLSGGDASG